MRASNRRWLPTGPALLAAGLAMSAIWGLAYSRPWWLWHHYPTPDLRPVLASAGEIALYGATLPLLFALYAGATWLAGRGTSPWADAVALAMPVLFLALLLPTLPATSSDVHHYVMEGRTLWVYGDNPLVRPPSSYPQDPYLHYVPPWHQDAPAPYGPLWALLTGLPSLLPQGRPEAVLLGYKALAALFFLATAVLLWLALGPAGPGQRRRGLLLYAWNPLLLMAAAVDGHNDPAMMFFLVGAVVAVGRGRWALSLPLAVLGALSKYVGALVGPLLLVHGWRRAGRGSRGGLLLGLALAVSLGLGLMAPFWEGPDTFRALQHDPRSWFANSLAEVALLGLAKLLPLGQAMGIARALAAVGFLVPYLLLLGRLRGDGRGVPWAAYQALFLYLTVGSTVFYHWYLAWVVPLAALLVGDPWRLPALLLSFTASFLPLIERMVVHLRFLQGDTGMQALVTVAVVLLPALLLWGWLAWRQWGWRLWELSPPAATAAVGPGPGQPAEGRQQW